MPKPLSVNKRKVDLSGSQFGCLTVIGPAPPPCSYSSHSYWLCRCNECGLERVVATDRLTSGATKRHGKICSRPHRVNPSRRKPPQRKPNVDRRLKDQKQVLVTYIYNKIRFNARARGYQFDLTKGEVEGLSFANCYYCGSEPAQIMRIARRYRTDFPYNGIDRIDNTLGYVPGNVRTACGQCNKAKAAYTEAEFLSWIARCHEHLQGVVA